MVSIGVTTHPIMRLPLPSATLIRPKCCAKSNTTSAIYKPSQPPDPITRTEPPQKGERRVTVKGPGNTALPHRRYKAPAATDPDYYALAVLNSAFAGGGSLGFFGSSTTNKAHGSTKHW